MLLLSLLLCIAVMIVGVCNKVNEYLAGKKKVKLQRKGEEDTRENEI